MTTNFMVAAHIRNQDYWTWAPQMDVIANDHYLDHRLDAPLAELAFAADTTRGLAQGRPWLLMEHSTGAVNWQPRNIAKGPGEMLRNSLAHLARGADGLCFFQWRASLQGSEKFHSAMVPHAGTDSQIWRDVVELGSSLGKLRELAGTTVHAEVAFVFSWEAWWAHTTRTRIRPATCGTSSRSMPRTGRSGMPASPSTSCLPARTSPPTGSWWSRTSTWSATSTRP
ncbi:hypothetical protein MN0502_24130 [Arthrobacter sp. MN05-02]|nr:hypothetical protein MN0502_24130 [Arthrobacter sp. MN05-02]